MTYTIITSHLNHEGKYVEVSRGQVELKPLENYQAEGTHWYAGAWVRVEIRE